MTDRELIHRMFDRSPNIAVRARARDRFVLTTYETPLQRLDRLRAAIGGDCPEIWIKRDDLLPLAMGGNKTRKLEFLLADARSSGADTVVTVGALQSNHARLTAAAAAAAGLGCVLVLRVPPHAGPEYLGNGNVRLDRILGARIVVVEESERDPHPERGAMERVVAELHEDGRRPYAIPAGGSTMVGALGYVRAYAEILAQGIDVGARFDEIVVASGSGGTQSGLIAGRAALRSALRVSEPSGPRIRGIAVSPDAAELRPAIAALVEETATALGVEDDAEVTLDDGFVGPGYGLSSPGAREAIELFARSEGILLDPVYTGKAAAALVAAAREGRYARDERVLFLHTGGVPALFAYPESVPENR